MKVFVISSSAGEITGAYADENAAMSAARLLSKISKRKGPYLVKECVVHKTAVRPGADTLLYGFDDNQTEITDPAQFLPWAR